MPGPLTIAVVSAKGGASKTTLALSLATSTKKKVTVIDTDASESSARSADVVGVDNCTARSNQALRRMLHHADGEIRILDTPPLYEDEPIVRQAISLADLVLVPLNPSPADIDRLPLLTPLLSESRWAIVITQERPYTRLGKQLRPDLKAAQLPVLPSGIPSRESIRTSWGCEVPDPPVGKKLWSDINRLMKKD